MMRTHASKQPTRLPLTTRRTSVCFDLNLKREVRVEGARNMSPKDHIYLVQCHSTYMSYEIQLYLYVVGARIHVVEHICRINYKCCTKKILLKIICILTDLKSIVVFERYVLQEHVFVR